jgi:hypothetical protein
MWVKVCEAPDGSIGQLRLNANDDGFANGFLAFAPARKFFGN